MGILFGAFYGFLISRMFCRLGGGIGFECTAGVGYGGKQSAFDA